MIAHVTRVVDERAENNGAYSLLYAVVFHKPEGIDRSEVWVTFAGTDSPNQMESKLVDAIVAEGQRFTYTVARTEVIFDGIERGQ